jgi:hypothetical protein
MLLIATSDLAIRNSEMEVGRDEFQTGAEVEAKITTARGKNLGQNIGDDHDVVKRNSYPI